ncbi:hypothetical protein D3C76_1312970 [compost metagenome]
MKKFLMAGQAMPFHSGAITTTASAVRSCCWYPAQGPVSSAGHSGSGPWPRSMMLQELGLALSRSIRRWRMKRATLPDWLLARLEPAIRTMFSILGFLV